MDEDEYKDAYFSLNTRVCPFEKALLSRQYDCCKADRLFIAERQAVGCHDAAARARCQSVLDSLRRNASFALKMTAVGGVLPHAREIKVQCGGLQGMIDVVDAEPGQDHGAPDIHHIVDRACARYGALEQLPYSEIVKAIAAYVLRRRGGRRGG